MTITMEESTHDLLQEARAGNREAFDRIIERHQDRLNALIHSRRTTLGAPGLDTDDILQETLMRAFTAVDRFEWRGEDSLFPWLAGIASNVILHLRRQNARRQGLPLEGDLSANSASPSRVLRRGERFNRLEDALNALSPDHREVIVLARIKGLKIKEIAERLNRKPNAVTQLLWRALEKLKENFGDTESFSLPDWKSLDDTESRDGSKDG